jgi:hypothetical protein
MTRPNERKLPKHHYIPVFYLKQWTNRDGILCEYSRKYKEVKASNGATESQSLIAAKTQPFRDHGGPQGQDRCTVDVDGSASAHLFQRDFKPRHAGSREKVMEEI